MGELVAWGLGLGLGHAAGGMLTDRWRVLLFVIVVLLLGALVTLLSGEMADEPWLTILDISQVAAAALLGIFVLPHAMRWLRGPGAVSPER